MLFCAEVPFSQQRKVQIGIPSDLNEPRLRRHASQRYVGRAKRESAGRGRRKFPGGTLLDLDEHRRELIQKDSHPVAVTSPDGLAAASAVAHYCDRGHDLILETFKSGTCQTELPSQPGFTPDKSSQVLSLSLDAGMLPPGSRGQ